MQQTYLHPNAPLKSSKERVYMLLLLERLHVFLGTSHMEVGYSHDEPARQERTPTP